ncbi:unnamed protein product [Effrenium voratum]|nr:unnamed protein product [Effrenium voratum]
MDDDLPYDELLALSLLGVSATLRRLEIQERVLESFGIHVPFEIDSACLEEVELSLVGLQLQIVAQRLILHLRLRDFDQAAQTMGAHAATAQLPQTAQPLLLKCLRSIHVDVKSLQLSVALPDAAERPWQLQAVLGAEVDLPLQLLDPKANFWHLGLRLKDLTVSFAPEGGCARGLLGSCGVQIHAEGAKVGELPDEPTQLRLAVTLAGSTGLRVNQQQLGLLMRMCHSFVLWDALLRSLGLQAAVQGRLKELMAMTGQGPVTNASFSLVGAGVLELGLRG